MTGCARTLDPKPMTLYCCGAITKPSGPVLSIGPAKEPWEQGQVLRCGTCGRGYEVWPTKVYVRPAGALLQVGAKEVVTP